ncbi:MAG: metallophosphoesterase [Armatimonadetes bacterium]|nr:metallophosphoesterase [Armatimonadota bacterium]
MELLKIKLALPLIASAFSVLLAAIAIQVWLPAPVEHLQWELRAAATLLAFPGFVACTLLGLPFFSLDGQAFSAMVTAATYFVIFRRAGAGRPVLEPAASIRLSRRRFLAGGSAVAAAVAVGGTGVIDRNVLQVTRHNLELPGLSSELSGLRIAMIADLHLGEHNSADFVAEAVRQVNELKPDLVVIPGDFIDSSYGYFAEAARVLRKLEAPLGALGTLGNHDHWEGADRGGRQVLEQAGIRLIDNQRRFLGRDRRWTEDVESAALAIAGVGDLWAGTVDLEQALAGIPESVPRVLLSHNPDVAEEPQALACHHRVDVMLSGHTHGGQIAFPVVGALVVPSRYGQKYASGWVSGPRWRVYVTRGVGTTGIPVRIGVPPEITLFTLA